MSQSQQMIAAVTITLMVTRAAGSLASLPLEHFYHPSLLVSHSPLLEGGDVEVQVQKNLRG